MRQRALSSVLLLGVSACDLVLGINGEYSVEHSPLGGAGGAGGSDGTTASMSSSTAGGTGGAGGELPVDCQATYVGPIGGVGAPDEGCPAGAMVRIAGGVAIAIPNGETLNLPDYCIHTREVTFAEYVPLAKTHGECFDEHEVANCAGDDPWSTLDVNDFESAPQAEPVHPTDYCDAFAYCRANGFRVCTRDEWRTACADGGADAPGGTHDCVDYPEIDPLSGTSTCHGEGTPRELVFDMIGNVAEHVACVTIDGMDCNDEANTLVLGARIDASGVENCRTGQGAPFLDTSGSGPLMVGARVGFRCCATPL